MCYRTTLRYSNNFFTLSCYKSIRNFSAQSSVQPVVKTNNTESERTPQRTDPEWINAKQFKDMPGPSAFIQLLSALPMNQPKNISVVSLHKLMYSKYGPVIFAKGILGRPNYVLTFDANDFEKVLRSEGPWPVRYNFETFVYYRKEVRQDIFKGMGGLLTEQGQKWADLRAQANPILLKPKNIKYYIPQIDQIAKEFLQRIKDRRDPITLETTSDFENEANRWSLESIAAVALNTRLGLVGKEGNNIKGEQLVQAVKDFFQLSFEFDVWPPIWKYYKNSKFKKLMKAFDTMTDVTLYYINETEKRLSKRDTENQSSADASSILAQLLQIDRHSAIVMSMDLLLAGVDTTSSVLNSTLYRLAKNPQKQDKLREEVLRVLPEKDSELIADQMNNMPYLRACIKETLRITGVFGGTVRQTQQDLVISGYQVPKGNYVVMSTAYTSNNAKYFPRTDEFLPERWLRETSEIDCPVAKVSNPFAFIPFGFGPRMCIGKRLAELEVETMLLRILRNFRVEWHHDDLQYRNNIICVPCGDIRFKLIDLP